MEPLGPRTEVTAQIHRCNQLPVKMNAMLKSTQLARLLMLVMMHEPPERLSKIRACQTQSEPKLATQKKAREKEEARWLHLHEMECSRKAGSKRTVAPLIPDQSLWKLSAQQ